MLESFDITGPEMLIMLAIFFFAVYVVKKVFSWVFTIAIVAIIVVGGAAFLVIDPQTNEPLLQTGEVSSPQKLTNLSN